MNYFKIKCIVPSKKKVYVSELSNEMFLALQKFILCEDLEGFYNCLDSLISTDEELTILDKVYCYIALFANCVRSNLELNDSSTPFFIQNNSYSLFDCLENLDDLSISNILKTFDTKIGPVTLTLGIPTRYSTIDEVFTFDVLSSIRKITINNTDYILKTQEDLQALTYIFSPEIYYKLTEFIIKNFSITISIIQGKIEIPLLSGKTYKFIAESLFGGRIDTIFTTMYNLQRHLNLSVSDYLKLTPADSEVVLVKFIEDKKKEKEEMERQEDASKGRMNALNL
jgi:hypothetical protein